MPRRHLLTFQLLGKDEILPEDEADLSKAWEEYVQSWTDDPVTKGLPLPESLLGKSAFLARNLAASRREKLPQLFARSELGSRICMRSYKMFWQPKTGDAMHRAWASTVNFGEVKEKRKKRWSKYLSKKEKEEQARTAAAEARRKEAEAQTAAAAAAAEKANDAAKVEQESSKHTASDDVPMPDAPSDKPAEAANKVTEDTETKPADTSAKRASKSGDEEDKAASFALIPQDQESKTAATQEKISTNADVHTGDVSMTDAALENSLAPVESASTGAVTAEKKDEAPSQLQGEASTAPATASAQAANLPTAL